jgi:hypothetical protein
MIDYIFYLSVDSLVYLAKITGLSYQEINFWLFLVVWPVYTVVTTTLLIYLLGQDQTQK